MKFTYENIDNNYVLVSDINELFHEHHRNDLAQVWFSMVRVQIFQYF